MPSAIAPRRHQHHFPLAAFELGDLLGPSRQRCVVQPLALIGDQAAADFDDERGALER